MLAAKIIAKKLKSDLPICILAPVGNQTDWQQEVQKTLGHDFHVAIIGDLKTQDKQFKKISEAKKNDVFIMTPNLLKNHAKNLELFKPSLILFDECHLYLASNSETALAVSKFAKSSKFSIALSQDAKLIFN